MNILFLGDVVAKSGRQAVYDRLPTLKREYAADFVIVNAENAAHGKGITKSIYTRLKEAGADIITLGNHAFSKKVILADLDVCEDMIRPFNMEPRDKGQYYAVRTCRKKKIAVINLLGSVFMNAADEDPVPCMDRILKEVEADILILDMHAEATSEKEMMFYRYRNRLTAVIGTHTHVQTADERIANGCAYITDAGMCGPYESILGRDVDEVMEIMVKHHKTNFTPAEGPAIISGVLIRVDESTCRAVSIERILERPDID